jgi:small nuclear ribonucleoprotein (snRNP)-like protein
MHEEELKQYLNKNVRIILKNSFNYSAKIIKVNSDCIQILDKYSNEVLIDNDQISIITMEATNGN